MRCAGSHQQLAEFGGRDQRYRCTEYGVPETWNKMKIARPADSCAHHAGSFRCTTLILFGSRNATEPTRVALSRSSRGPGNEAFRRVSRLLTRLEHDRSSKACATPGWMAGCRVSEQNIGLFLCQENGPGRPSAKIRTSQLHPRLRSVSKRGLRPTDHNGAS
ncbi:hypothetical protein N657DRAFT_162609 [Parathielavia appendiculata]|uniref:Uncharacterized protein n=1 Tax=Parathielavia appendiculata TaxID=2587402 RepID=A0AAN6TU50_9PEZI|nr:hypothetical protein N657DRAFT_162609 [Parathielavia appendiculata]